MCASYKNEKVKDKTTLFIYSRLARDNKADLDYFIPLVLPAMIREDRMEDFDRLQASLSPEFRTWATYLQTMVVSINELLQKGDYTRAHRIFLEIKPHWTEKRFSVLEKIQQKLSWIEYDARLKACLNQLEQKLNTGPLQASDPLFDQLERLLSDEPDIPPEIKNEIIQNPKWKPGTPFTFLVRAIAQVDGLLPRFGRRMLDYGRRNPMYAQALMDSIFKLQSRPDSWPDWRQFIERIEPSDPPDMRCLYDYSRAFLLEAQEKQFAKAEAVLRTQVLPDGKCPLPARQHALELLNRGPSEFSK